MTREEAIENLKFLRECSYVDTFEDAENEALDMAISALSENKGKWIVTTVRGSMSLVCSECGADLGSICETNFCPYCGVDMRG